MLAYVLPSLLRLHSPIPQLLRPRLRRLILPHLLQQLRIPALADIRMALDAIHQRRLAEVFIPSRLERELDAILPPPPALDDLAAQLLQLGVDGDALERRVVADALEERDGEARAGARGGRQHAVRGGRADAGRQRLHALPDGDDERAGDGRAVDPRALQVLHLQPAVRRRLQQVAAQHGVLVRADALALLVAEPQLRHVGVLDDLELVLLVGVEVAVEGVGAQADRLGDQGGEEERDRAHARHVVFEGGAEVGEDVGRRPERGREQVVVQRRGGGGQRVRGREVDLLAVVGAVRCGFGVEARVAEEGAGGFHLDFEPGRVVRSSSIVFWE